MRTERWLRVKDTTNLNYEQKQNRLKALRLLNTYWKQEIFPKNTTHQGKIPQIMDQSGTLCAVAFIMHNSGHQNLIKEISQKDNYAYVDDIPDDHPLVHSLKECGISKKEAARIQPVYGSCEFYTPPHNTYGSMQVVEPIVAILVSLAALVIATAIPIYLRTSGFNFRPIPIVLIVGITIAGTMGFAVFSQPYDILSFDEKRSLQSIPDHKGTKETYPIDKTHSIVYWIDGAKVTEFLPKSNTSSLLIDIQTSSDGEMIIVLPRVVYGSSFDQHGQLEEVNEFFVLTDGEEANFERTITSKDQTLTIPFKDGTRQIEVIAVGYCTYPFFGQ